MAIDITGTTGDDVINDTSALNGTGTASPNASVNISGLSGFDRIYGSFNKDTLYGNAGDDLILGNGGSDTIFGGQGNDRLYVTGANGAVTTEPALAIRSKVVGGLGQDSIFVGGETAARNSEEGLTGRFIGQVTVFGGAEGTDRDDQGDLIDVRLDANSYAEIYSNGGNDLVFLDGVGRPNAGELGSRFFVHAGQGNDQIYGDVGVNSTIYGGLGADIIEVDALNAVTIFGGNGNADAIDGNDVIDVFIEGDAFAAEGFVPTALITGNGGSDFIRIGSEDGVQASIYGGQGFDTIVGAGLEDNSYVAGGLGTDIIDVTVAGSNVSILGGNGSTDPADGLDVIYARIDEGATAQIFGNGGDDFISVGGEGSATVYGGAGDDRLIIGSFNEDQNIIPKSIVVYGGQGSDLFQIEARQDDRTEAALVRIADFNFDEDFIAGDQVDDLVAVSGRANNFFDILDLAEGALNNDDAAIVTIDTGALAGTYLVYDGQAGEQVVNITGYAGTADADVFIDPVNNFLA